MTTEQALQLLQSSLSVATTTGDAAEGVRAFAEKRSPEWRS
jgi:enoyl-CoA hydratase/carnithine racemase